MQIRLFLRIAPEDQMIVERYSDSATSFVVLDSNNLPVYKQLYRAAKAKSKLKLRVSVLQLQPKTTPKPVTVEDAPEPSVAETYESTENITPTESGASQSTTDSATEMPTPSTAPSSITLLSGVELPLRTSSSVLLDTVETTKVEQEQEQEVEAPDADSLPANFAQSAPFDPQTVYSSFQEYCDPALQSHFVLAPAPFAVCCNHCEKTVADVHYHCQTCDDGDFDLCQACVDQAVSCYDENHWLIKRTMVDGQLVASSTERIEPKSQAKKEAESPVQEDSVPESTETPEREEYTVETVHIENAPEPSVSKPVVEEPLRSINVAPAFPPRVPFIDPAGARWSCLGNMRTCNCCVQGMFI
jgi:next-to-BRCA1 protein 1